MKSGKVQEMLIYIGNMCGDHNKGDLAILEATHRLLKRHFPAAKMVIQNIDNELPALEKTGLNRWSGRLADRYHGSFVPRIGGRRGSFLAKALDVLLDFILSMYLLALAGLVRALGRPLSRLVPSRHREAWRDLVHSDLVVGKGGCYLVSNVHSPLKDTLFLYRMCHIFLLARILGKKVVLLGHSIGPVRGIVRRWLVRNVLKGAYAIVVREELSRDYVERELGAPPGKVHLCPDLAFWFAGEPVETVPSSLPILPEGAARPPRLLGVTVREWSFPETRRGKELLERYVDGMVAFMRGFLERHPDTLIVLLPHCLLDLPLSYRIAEITCSSKVRVVEEDLSTDGLRSLMRNLDCLVGTRIHSNILALTVGTPVVPIIYQTHKGVGIMRMAGVPEDSFFFIQDLDPDALVEAVEKTLFHRTSSEPLRSRILETALVLKEQIRENLKRLFG